MLTHYTDTQMVGHACATNIGVWVVILRPPIALCAPAMLMALEVNAYLDHVYRYLSRKMIVYSNAPNRLNTSRSVRRYVVTNRDFRLPPRSSRELRSSGVLRSE